MYRGLPPSHTVCSCSGCFCGMCGGVRTLFKQQATTCSVLEGKPRYCILPLPYGVERLPPLGEPNWTGMKYGNSAPFKFSFAQLIKFLVHRQQGQVCGSGI